MIAPIRKSITHTLHKAEEWIFANPKIVLSLIFLVTLVFAAALPKLRIYSDFSDLLPQEHSYIQTYNRIKENFGGANMIVMAIEVEQGTIFNNDTLKLVHEATQGVDNLPSVNHNLVSSLTHRTARKVFLSPEGSFVSQPYYDPAKNYSADELAQMQRDVIANPNLFGLMVSPDFKAALIKAQLNESELDYVETFAALQKVRDTLARDGHKVHVTGNPVLTGWVYTYLDQIVQILAWTLALLATLLIVYFRRLYGIALPLLGIALSSIWGLGFMAMAGINLEPLSLPIPFLIAARATSHGVQLVVRYYEELAIVKNGKQAARNALDALFRPGSLAIIVDAVGIAVLVLGAAPFNYKLGLAAGFWGFSVIFTVHFMVPLALTVLPQPKTMENANEGVRNFLGNAMARTGGTDGGARAILFASLACVVVGSWYVAKVQLGESEPGSPLLNRDHDYNVSTAAINTLFPGSEELHIVARTEEKGGIKRPEVMHAIERFQAHMLSDPTLGGARALPGVVRVVNQLTHNDDPRWAQIPDNADEVGGLMFAYMASSPIPGALKEYINPDENEANMVFFYKDHQAETINRVVALAEEGKARIEAEVPGLKIELGGGIIGVTAAANQALHTDHMIIIPAVMLLAFLLVMAYYQSLHAGWLMVLPMLFATVMTYAYMGWANIGISVNTVPVIAVGVGVGIDYAVYFMDRIREEMAVTRNIHRAVVNAVATTGYAVSFTAATLIAGVVMWIFMSDLRFQSDAAVLLSFMLVVNALAAMLIVPAWCVVFRPHFVVATHYDEDGVLEEDDAPREVARAAA
ncbi:MAG: MMPL family transporter [Methyloversatilis sp.]|jgi:predicted RND superfamily exporter protein|uniref:efflux RND transporter permease subunit n=1 Tax=Methyloversatilis sp. TaxID=2569862 RepID=UPI0025DBF5D3|nr:MMPL family transporter [Methyloversatilis sp.]MCR6667778.1 MMPL family transporter [Methyloversatilis sp.]